METIEITRRGRYLGCRSNGRNAPVAARGGIEPLELQPVRILNASVRFGAAFANDRDAERFRLRFDEEGAGTPA